ncbi:hypothetical protein Prum_084160 [Phytohabitans rumicis]|uniref:Alcohol dehydrogenase-like C-terminal domain-containing protein n=1 Tax=Phytohabitans rumicis TaxID=1076125 RepID=A0A6V8LES8_9ACTN|nr:hypothetical protein Prum_084160 [Phytohabitans rumicis]
MSGPGTVEVQRVKREPVRDGTFRVNTLYSGVSAGTELSYVKGTNPYLSASWDAALGLFRPGEPSTVYPVTRLGYMEVGRVAESATPAVREGAVVAMAYGHRTGYLADPLTDRFVPLPPDLDPILGVYVAHAGPICANGLLHAAADLYGPGVRDLGDGIRGRRVAVVGAGLVGLLTALFASRHGAQEVVVLDETSRRRAVAEALGLAALNPAGGDPAVALKTRWRAGPGADVVFQCRGRAAALHLALRLPRPQGTVIDLAFYQGGADAVRLGRSSTTTGWRCGARRSAGCRAGCRRRGTGTGCRRRRSRCCASAARRSGGIWSPRWCRSTRRRACSPTLPRGAARRCRRSWRVE